MTVTPHLSLDQWRALIAVVEAGGYAQAAEALHLTQSALSHRIRKLEQESPNILDLVLGHQIDLIIDIPAQGAERSHDGFIIRRNAIETGVNVLTSLDTANAVADCLAMDKTIDDIELVDITKI